jgi:nucleotide-binding universal stress UspA family protein
MIGLARMQPEEIRAAQQSAAREVFQNARAVIGPGQQVEETVLMGDPAQEIIGYVAQHPRALVVMGRRGLSPMQSLLVGSVSDKVVRHASAAVMLVN